MTAAYILRCNKKKIEDFIFSKDEILNYKPKIKKEKIKLPKDVNIKNLISFLKEEAKEKETVNKIKNPHCPSCNMDLFTVSFSGVFGCDDCFSFFEKSLKEKFPKQYEDYYNRINKETEKE